MIKPFSFDILFFVDVGQYWVVGVDIEQYDKHRPDKYLHGLLEENTNPSLLRAFESYFSIVGSATDYSVNFTNIINEYRKKPPFNFINPIENYGGVVQVGILNTKLTISNFIFEFFEFYSIIF